MPPGEITDEQARIMRAIRDGRFRTNEAMPYVIENVRTKALRDPFMLCGSQFGLPIRRHRYFETNWRAFQLDSPCLHRGSDFSFDHGGKQPESVYRAAMGVAWMTVGESRQAIPPAMTEHIGGFLLTHLQTLARAA
jgi:DNA (cytosine-5)-methyltransferase 1